MQSKISVLICAHNEEKYISTALNSVLKEKLLDLEVVVVDDRSSDRTPEILKSLVIKDARIKIITRVDVARNENIQQGLYYAVDHGYGGQTDALNLGLLHCTGDYIARLDADDVCFPERLRVQLEFMKQNPEVSFLGCSAIRIDSDGREFGTYHSEPLLHEQIIENIKNFKAYAPHSSWFVNAKLYKDLKGYNCNGFRAEDLDFMLRASELSGVKFAFLEQPLIYLRMQDNRLSTDISTRPVEHAIEAVVRNLLRLDGVEITDELQQNIRNSVSNKIKQTKLIKKIIAYRALVNAFIAMKTGKLINMIYFVLM